MRRTISLTSFVFLALGLSLALVGCDYDEIVQPAVDELLAVPQELRIGGHEYVLATVLWRDFMPTVEPGGRGLIAVVRVTEVDSLEIPPDLGLTRLWVINGDDVWATGFSDETRPPVPAYQLEGVARNGPPWGPLIAVDVVVELVDGGGEAYLLRAADQWIQRTD